MLLKKWFRQLHLIAGLFSGTIVFIVAVTGSIYAFEEEFRSILYKDLMHVEQQTVKKPLTELITNAKAEFPNPAIRNIRIKANPTSSVEIILKNKQSILVDPYTGKVLGTYNKETDFFGVVLQIHRSLYLGEPGKIITGISATIFIFMLISGIILWWPKNTAFLKHKFSIAKNTAWKKKNYDLHSVLGFYASWIIIFTALTGIIWSFKWAENSMYWLNHSKKEERKQYHSTWKEDSKPMALDKVIARAGFLYLQSDECFINMPEDSAGIYKLTLRYDDGGFFRKTDQLYFDQYNGELLKAQLFENSSQGDKMKATNYNIHTGKVFGRVGQIITFLAALISASLPVTGFMMWRGKRRRKRA
jgi:uncharacterized iron-regulated membrane protein